MNILVTVDTEADNQWDSNGALTVDNLAYLPRFQRLCRRYHLRPTYLCTYEVVRSPAFDEILLGCQDDGAEIGAHLHPWSTPPFLDGGPLAEQRAYPSELPVDTFRQKMEVLTQALMTKTHQPPRSYRAGRWGFCASHIPVLLAMGYTVDCSVTPHVSWEQTRGMRVGGPDFRTAPVRPYELDDADVCREGSTGLLETPVTILCTNRLLRNAPRLQHQWRTYQHTVPGRLLNKCLRLDNEWFRPYPHMTAPRLKRVYLEAVRLQLPAVQLMLHSSELMPGGSPYNTTRRAVERLYTTLDTLFALLAERQERGSTLAAFATEYLGIANASGHAAA